MSYPLDARGWWVERFRGEPLSADAIGLLT